MQRGRMTEELSDVVETPEARESRVLTARVKEFGHNYTLAVNDNERARTDNAARDFIYSFLFRAEEQDNYWEMYMKESGRHNGD